MKGERKSYVEEVFGGFYLNTGNNNHYLTLHSVVSGLPKSIKN